jgi:hypothetical protein
MKGNNMRKFIIIAALAALALVTAAATASADVVRNGGPFS